MNWTSSLFVALLTGAAGMVVSGAIAALAVDWYHIPAREGESGYFVVLLALLGLVAGAVVGVVGSRIVASAAHPGFFRALALSLAAILALAGGIGGVARLLADVPPEIDGEPLLLVVELRMPEGDTASPAAIPGEGYLRLHSVPALSHTVRATESGVLWKEDARQEAGRWLVPGAVSLFTSRGKRMLEISLDGEHSAGFVVPLPGHPGRSHLQWSDWLPRARPGTPAPPAPYSYRFRVQRWVEPVRLQRFGSFTVGTVVSHFYPTQVPGQRGMEAAASFMVRFEDQPVRIGADAGTTEPPERIEEVTVIPGPRPALLVQASPATGAACALLAPGAGRPVVQAIPGCGGVSQAAPLTADTAVFRSARARAPRRGWIEQLHYQRPGLYLLGNSVLDTRALSIHSFDWDTSATLIPDVPPLGLSPDERSFARFVYAESSEDHPAILVTDFADGRSYLLPIDRTRMRFADFDALDPAWLLHHFRWERGPGGVDRLAERPDFTPFPYQGQVSLESGDRHVYRIEKGSAELRTALVAFLAREFNGVAVPAEPEAYEQPVTVDGQTVNVAWSSDFKYVAVSMPYGATDTRLVATIGERFNAALRTGRYDALFVP